MTDLQGNDSPSGVGEFLIWQQPHPIYYAELLYREKPEKKPLKNMHR
jgi:protein-glucosylgalactosylhydroxylysine glucosidase